jgi:hypothetical protein
MMSFERGLLVGHLFGHHFGLPHFELFHVFFVVVALNLLLMVVLLDLLLHSTLVLGGNVAQVLQTNVIQRIMMRSVETVGSFFLVLVQFLVLVVATICIPMFTFVSQKTMS